MQNKPFFFLETQAPKRGEGGGGGGGSDIWEKITFFLLGVAPYCISLISFHKYRWRVQVCSPLLLKLSISITNCHSINEECKCSPLILKLTIPITNCHCISLMILFQADDSIKIPGPSNYTKCKTRNLEKNWRKFNNLTQCTNNPANKTANKQTNQETNKQTKNP